MAVLRRKLRTVTITWLVFQAAWLIALVPRDCCAAHRPPAATTCHESMPAAQSSPVDCRLTGGCDGPMAALFALLSNHGIMPEFTAVIPDVEVSRITVIARENVGGQFHPPDPPPPRA
jgi:hypothetical protein